MSSHTAANTSSNGRLAGKVAIITGASTGIGKATAERFVREGAKVVLVARSAEKLDAIVADLGKENAVAVVGDVSEEKVHELAVAAALEKFGALHIAFNNAGIARQAPIDQVKESDAREILNTNVFGVLFALKHQIPALKKNGPSGGSIINNSSVVGLRITSENLSVYAASKFAVIGLTQSAAVETAAHNIRVNVVAPGVVETPAYGADAKASANELANRVHLIRRAGTSDEVASSVLFLASDEASFITGSTLSVDGGAQLRGQSN